MEQVSSLESLCLRLEEISAANPLTAFEYVRSAKGLRFLAVGALSELGACEQMPGSDLLGEYLFDLAEAPTAQSALFEAGIFTPLIRSIVDECIEGRK
jgi:hypothetical protein